MKFAHFSHFPQPKTAPLQKKNYFLRNSVAVAGAIVLSFALSGCIRQHVNSKFKPGQLIVSDKESGKSLRLDSIVTFMANGKKVRSVLLSVVGGNKGTINVTDTATISFGSADYFVRLGGVDKKGKATIEAVEMR